MDLNDFIENFKQILDEPEEIKLSSETTFKHIDEWDSMTALSVIIMKDQDYDCLIKDLIELYKICKSIKINNI